MIDRAAKHGVRIQLSLTGPAPRWANAKACAEAPLVQAERDRVRQVRRARGGALQGPRGPVQHLERAELEDLARPARVRPRALPPALLGGYDAIKTADPAAKVLIGETRAVLTRRATPRRRSRSCASVDCVNTNYKRARSCPKLKADGYAHHPYDFGHAPNYQYTGKDNVTIGTLWRLTNALDKLSRAGVLRMNGGGKMPLYLTEYGYFRLGPPRPLEGCARATSSRRTRSR